MRPSVDRHVANQGTVVVDDGSALQNQIIGLGHVLSLNARRGIRKWSGTATQQ